MIELIISKKALKTFEKIINAYESTTIIPKKHNWKELTNNELWLTHIGQVMVVGGSISKIRFDKSEELKHLVHFISLKKITSEEKLLKTINQVLRKAKVRYASAIASKSAKSRALLHNYLFLAKHKGGFKAIMRMLDSFSGEKHELKRVQFLMENMKFMKSKSARDFLMGLGMNTGTIAIDIRIQNIFIHVGTSFPAANKLSNPKVYDELERQIIENLCKPLNIEPLVFDRILYQNYDKILRYDYLMPRLF
jgi:hypothetical protein